MRVFLNRRPIVGPWGGGNRVVAAICDELSRRGHEVTFDVTSKLDVLFCFDPRPAPGLCGFDEMVRAKMSMGVPLIQRVGDLGTHGKPDLTVMVMYAVSQADKVLFPSQWALDVLQTVCVANNVPIDAKNWSIIQNAPDDSFKTQQDRTLESLQRRRIEIITHHWSTNPKKGFDFYRSLDSDPHIRAQARFTYAGRLPLGIGFSSYVGVLDVDGLVSSLAKADVYVSASIEEAGANHVLEAMAMGLPVIYHQRGGSTPEYCRDFGVAFDGTLESFQRALEHVMEMYDVFQARLKAYTRRLSDVVISYVDAIEQA